MPDTYYWAGGRKVRLEETEEVAVDLDSAAGAALSSSGRAARTHALSSSLVLVPRSDAVTTLGAAASGPGVHPVFRYEDGSRIVVLPQVRVEAGDDKTLTAIGDSLTGAHVAARSEGRLDLEPDSRRGEDALALANRLAESYEVDVAQARFVRLLPRPEPPS